MYRVLIVFSFLFFSVLFGASPCLNIFDRWNLSGDFLYLEPTIEDTYFANHTTATHYTLISNDPQYTPAWRIQLTLDLYQECDIVGANYMNLRSYTKKTAALSPNAPITRALVPLNVTGTPLGDGCSLINTMDYWFQQGEVFLKHTLCSMRSFFLQPRVGLEIAYLRWKSEDSYVTEQTSGRLDQRSQLQALGPQVGMTADYLLWDLCYGRHTLSLYGDLFASLLAGNLNVNGTLREADERHSLRFDSLQRVIPTWQVRLGLDVNTTLLCWPLSFKAGYELRSYFNSVYKQQWINTPTQLNGTYQTFSLQGMYASAGIHF